MSDQEYKLGDIATQGWEAGNDVLDWMDVIDMNMRFVSGKTDGFLPDGPAMKGLNAVVDGATLGMGGAKLGLGLANGDAVQSLDGVHDVLAGGSGVLSQVGGPVGAVAEAFGAGFALGDMIAPLLFGGDEEWSGSRIEEMGVDGTSNPRCGNAVFDWLGDTLTGGSESLVGAAGYHKGLNGWNPPD